MPLRRAPPGPRRRYRFLRIAGRLRAALRQGSPIPPMPDSDFPRRHGRRLRGHFQAGRPDRRFHRRRACSRTYPLTAGPRATQHAPKLSRSSSPPPNELRSRVVDDRLIPDCNTAPSKFPKCMISRLCTGVSKLKNDCVAPCRFALWNWHGKVGSIKRDANFLSRVDQIRILVDFAVGFENRIVQHRAWFVCRQSTKLPYIIPASIAKY